jgi:predicted transcriptional regulator
MNAVKEEAIEAIKTLDDNATWADLVYTLYVKQVIAESEEDVKAGRLVSHEDIKKEFLNDNNMDL